MIDVTIFDAIDSPLAKDIRERLTAAPREPVTLRIHSPGGELFAGLAIHAALKAHAGRVTAVIEGVAASAASVVAMAADQVFIAEHGFLMLHDPSMAAAGGADDLRSAAELVERTREQLIGIYAERGKIDRETLAQMMNKETWLDAHQALAAGFVDKIIAGRRIAATWRPADHFQHPPDTLEHQTMSATLQDIRAACPGAPAEFVLKQIEAEATIDQARAAWLDEREKRVAAAEQKSKSHPPGTAGLSDRDPGKHRQAEGDADEFNRLVDEQIEKGKMRIDAVALVGRKYPHLHHAFVSATNRETGRVQSLIGERFNQ